MPIVAHRRRERWIRSSGSGSGSAAAPPTDNASSPAAPPGRALAVETLRLLRRFDDPNRIPVEWFAPAFIREVGLVRAHLAPIRSRAGLAASFSSEAFHGFAAVGAAEPPGPTRVAYAIRWLELGDGCPRPVWPDRPNPATPGA